jgi:hypothetical protein
MLNLTPEQQAIFDRVIGIVTKNDELRRQYKIAHGNMDTNPNSKDLDYINDSDEPDAVNFRAASDAVSAEVNKVSPRLKIDDIWLFHKVSIAVCHHFIDA